MRDPQSAWAGAVAPVWEAVPENARKAIIAVYKGRCQYCRTNDANHVDHIIARANGGTSDLDNLTLGCASCNMAKGALSFAGGRRDIASARTPTTACS